MILLNFEKQCIYMHRGRRTVAEAVVVAAATEEEEDEGGCGGGGGGGGRSVVFSGYSSFLHQ
jgi:hypothetical protein